MYNNDNDANLIIGRLHSDNNNLCFFLPFFGAVNYNKLLFPEIIFYKYCNAIHKLVYYMVLFQTWPYGLLMDNEI